MNSTQLVQIRQDFYRNIRKRVESILGKESRDLVKYRRVYEAEVEKLPWQIADKKSFFKRLKQADVTIVGDFHVQKQSSRAFLRIIRKMTSPMVLALECLRAVDQPHIDAYLNGEISEKEFLTKVAWKKNWSFPWENYRPLFKWAQLHQVRIYGINTDRIHMSLLQRDRFSAAKIASVRKKYPQHQIFVQYGDLHLASRHLPKEIKKCSRNTNVCVVFQSPEILYFRVMQKQKELGTDVIKMTSDIWALNSLPPWIKWQDYLLHLESGYDKRVKGLELDPTDTVANTVKFVTNSLGLNVSLDELSVYTSDDDQLFSELDHLPVATRKKVISLIQEGYSFYLPEAQCGFLARYSLNHVTRVAAQYAYYKIGGYKKSIFDIKKDFYRSVWLEAVVYLFSKVKNPKRKTDTLFDIRNALQKEQFDDRGKEALMLALTAKLAELQFLSTGKFKPLNTEESSKYSQKSYMTAAQILGGMIGEKIFYALNRKMIKFPQNKNLIFKDLSAAQFQKIYFESLDIVESWPQSFKSKYDKL